MTPKTAERKIICVGWDADATMYEGFITSRCAERNTQDPKPYVADIIKYGWATPADIVEWRRDYNDGKEIETVGDVARLLTDLFYKMERISKAQIIEGKQFVLRGMTMREICGFNVKEYLYMQNKPFKNIGWRNIAMMAQYMSAFGQMLTTLLK